MPLPYTLNSLNDDVLLCAQDYTDNDTNGDEDDVDTTTSTTATITTTTTTMRPKSSLSQNYDYKDLRAYDSGTGAQYNGYQAKNDYPPMSAHSIHKWQSLGTREGVKETRSNMQQYNKNGKSECASDRRVHLDDAHEVFLPATSLLAKKMCGRVKRVKRAVCEGPRFLVSAYANVRNVVLHFRLLTWHNLILARRTRAFRNSY